MMTDRVMDSAGMTDTQLVTQALDGDRDAFGQIVSRYQALICSLAYSATGSLGQSEDLAQETFITAWKHLRLLRERQKLRAWLCGIARRLVGKALRREGREPTHGAKSLDLVPESAAAEPLPPERAISREEEALLWRAMERIPESYREPLVLFYREHQSVEKVAEALDLSEEAVRQRLSRGRRLLHQEVLSFVEGALEHSTPGKAFTVGVLAALPLLATTSTATAAGLAAAKGGATVKSATGVGTAGAILTGALLLLFSLLAGLAFLGGCIGFLMSRTCRQSAGQLQNATRFWRTLALGFAALLVIPQLAAACLGLRPGMHPMLYERLTLWLGLLYPLVLGATALWLWRWWRELCQRQPDTAEPGRLVRRHFAVWLGLGMSVPAFFVATFLIGLFQKPLSAERLTPAEAQQIVSERGDASYKVRQARDGSKTLWIKLPEHSARVACWTPADESILALLAQHNISYPTRVEGRDYEVLGTPGRWLVLLSFFVAPVGGVILLRWRRDRFQGQAAPTDQMQRSVNRAFRILAVAAALVMVAVGLFIALNTRWNVQAISGEQARKFIAEHRDAQFEIVHYNNGTRHLDITPAGSRGGPRFTAPADKSTLSLLTGVNYRERAQGRTLVTSVCVDPVPWVSALLICALLAGAAMTFWRALRGLKTR